MWNYIHFFYVVVRLLCTYEHFSESKWDKLLQRGRFQNLQKKKEEIQTPKCVRYLNFVKAPLILGKILKHWTAKSGSLPLKVGGVQTY